MRPTLTGNGTMLITPDGVMIPWDSAHSRPVDHEGEAGRVWRELKAEFGIDQPDPPAPPSKAERNAPVIAKLDEIDRKSIRALREWIAAQPSAPHALKDYQAAADAERAKLIK